jgi:hypothetical protein
MVIVAVLGLAAVGCAADDDSGGGAAIGPELHATLGRSTLLETHRALSLTVEPDRDVRIGSVQLSSPLFASLPAESRTTRVRAGGIVSLPLPYGKAVCKDEGDDPTLLIASIDGHEVRAPLRPRPAGMLTELHDAECADAAVAAKVDLRLADDWTPTGPRRGTGVLELSQQHAGVHATIDDVVGNVIFHVAPATPQADRPDPWLEVDDDHPTARAPVSVEVARCDPHALIEYKHPFRFSAWVATSSDPDVEPTRVDVEAEGSTRKALGNLFSDCLPTN